ncbi:hypothetical protein M408DRAFT_328925 [Serendipita vermifera MAFF 305830]|uniref:DUF6533 domain-containing protein n=1 Tax=Serendipita vermifera MAFF 305830 TaxID=933852 RepID=A0A0C3BCS6_SERVB|nr:hypothetical protein M408DRAFT_328925 [Serendipita vermifera MAFF 305830]
MVLSIPPGLTPAQLLDLFEQLKTGLRSIAAGKYALVAGLTLALYDHLLTLDREKRYIWKARGWSTPRAIFLFTRYSVPLILLGHCLDNLGGPRADELCLRWSFANTYWTFVLYSMMHWLVALRVYAYWGRSRRVLFSFVALWSIAFIATTTEATIWLVNYKGTAAYDPILKSCSIGAPTWLPVINVGFLILEIPAFCLTAWKFRQDSKVLANSLLIKTLIRDGVLYFFIVLGLTTGTALFTYLAPLAMSGVPRFLTLGIVDVTVSRLVLSLHEVAAKAGVSNDQKPSTGSTTVAVNQFGTYKARPSRDGVAGGFYGHSRAASNASAYPMDTMGSARKMQQPQHIPRPVPESWPPDQTMIIGNPYSYVEETERPQV